MVDKKKRKAYINLQNTPVLNRICGVYFLIKNGVVNYVGKSRDIRSRVAAHSTDHRIPFDKVRYIELESDEDALDAERYFINVFHPEYNGIGFCNDNSLYNERVISAISKYGFKPKTGAHKKMENDYQMDRFNERMEEFYKKYEKYIV